MIFMGKKVISKNITQDYLLITLKFIKKLQVERK